MRDLVPQLEQSKARFVDQSQEALCATTMLSRTPQLCRRTTGTSARFDGLRPRLELLNLSLDPWNRWIVLPIQLSDGACW